MIPPAYVPANGWLWDPWFYVEGETIHLFHLLQRGNREKVTAVVRDSPVIAHAQWSAAEGWRPEEPAIEQTGTWYDAERIHTGCVVKESDGYAMLYSASNTYVALAHSPDLVTWTKFSDNPVARPDPERSLPHWRDPWLLVEGVDDRYTMVIAAQRASSEGEPVGVVAVAHAGNLNSWRQDEPLLTPPWFEWMEVPEVHRIANTWVLVFVTRAKWLTALGQTALAASGLEARDGAYCFTADHWRGPYGNLRFLSCTDPPGYTTRLVQPEPGQAWLWGHVEERQGFYLARPRPVRLEKLASSRPIC